jgi:hypothetical protein
MHYGSRASWGRTSPSTLVVERVIAYRHHNAVTCEQDIANSKKRRASPVRITATFVQVAAVLPTFCWTAAIIFHRSLP